MRYRRLGRTGLKISEKVLAHPAVSTALVGPRTEVQWEEALASLDWTLPAEEVAALGARAF